MKIISMACLLLCLSLTNCGHIPNSENLPNLGSENSKYGNYDLEEMEKELEKDPSNCDLILRFAKETFKQMKYDKFLLTHDQLIKDCNLSSTDINDLDTMIYIYSQVHRDSSRLVNTNVYFNYIKEIALLSVEKTMADSAIWGLRIMSNTQKRKCDLYKICSEIYLKRHELDSVRKYEELISKECK